MNCGQGNSVSNLPLGVATSGKCLPYLPCISQCSRESASAESARTSCAYHQCSLSKVSISMPISPSVRPKAQAGTDGLIGTLVSSSLPVHCPRSTLPKLKGFILIDLTSDYRFYSQLTFYIFVCLPLSLVLAQRRSLLFPQILTSRDPALTLPSSFSTWPQTSPIRLARFPPVFRLR